MSDYPDRIWVGFIGGGRLWGPVSKDTHPDNVQYVRADTIPTIDIDAIHAKPECSHDRVGAIDTQCRDCGERMYEADEISQPLPSEHKPDVVKQLVEALEASRQELKMIYKQTEDNAIWVTIFKIETALKAAEQDKQ